MDFLIDNTIPMTHFYLRNKKNMIKMQCFKYTNNESTNPKANKKQIATLAYKIILHLAILALIIFNIKFIEQIFYIAMTLNIMNILMSASMVLFVNDMFYVLHFFWVKATVREIFNCIYSGIRIIVKDYCFNYNGIHIDELYQRHTME